MMETTTTMMMPMVSVVKGRQLEAQVQGNDQSSYFHKEA